VKTEDAMSDFSSEKKIDPADSESVVEKVRERYAVFASTGSSCCGTVPTTCCGSADTVSERLGYSTVDLDLLPDGANLGLGCGAPLEHVDLEPGETMLDLGSGAGIDALIASKKVGSEGLVIGVDMTPEMLESARANADRAGIRNVDFREGRLEQLPVDDDSVDVVTSNCVINLVPDKSTVFGEVARVLRSGGRLVISDIVLDGELPETVQKNVMAYVGCVAGAERREKYFEMLETAGLGDVEILKDVDFLQLTEKASPAEVISIIEAAGIDRKDVEGIVRSVTYRARKR
jgi:ubiquinone/menaquinone biosynthesis C-methylase UbiE